MRIHATSCMGGIVMTNDKFLIELAMYKYWLSTNPPMREVAIKSERFLQLVEKPKTKTSNKKKIP